MADKNYGLSTVVDDVDNSDKSSSNRVRNHGETVNSEHQVLDRYINLIGIVNFGIICQGGWQPMGYLLALIMFNGGPAAFIWGLVFAAIGALGVAASLAEMASMDPHVGAQYRWSAGFARSHPEFWGLMQGWITVFAWIVNVAPVLIFLAQTVQGLIVFHVESYEPENWHTTMFMIAFLAVSFITNLYCRKLLGPLEILGGVCHVLFFIVVIMVLTTTAQRSTASFVFKTLISDLSGWNNAGVSWNLGVAPLVIGLINCDGVTHMIDETRNPRSRVPKTMLTAVGLNAIMSISMAITLLFCIGDLERTLGSFLPILEIYYQATNSKAGATVLMIMTVFCIVVAMFNLTASTTRLTWAFARDRGLPFQAFFSQVHPTLKIPLQALGLVSFILAIVSLINIGSSVAFAALISLPTVALCVSYIIPIILITIRKLKNEHPQYGPFRLGKWGLPINLWAICFLIWCLIWTPFPTIYPVDAQNMNWAGPITLAVILLALLDYFTGGQTRFKVPSENFNNIEMYDQQELEEAERKQLEKLERKK